MDLTTFKLPETRGKNQSFLHPPASTSPGGPGLKRRCWGRWRGGGRGGLLSGECKAQKASEGEQKRRADKIIPSRGKPKPWCENATYGKNLRVLSTSHRKKPSKQGHFSPIRLTQMKRYDRQHILLARPWRKRHSHRLLVRTQNRGETISQNYPGVNLQPNNLTSKNLSQRYTSNNIHCCCCKILEST